MLPGYTVSFEVDLESFEVDLAASPSSTINNSHLKSKIYQSNNSGDVGRSNEVEFLPSHAQAFLKRGPRFRSHASTFDAKSFPRFNLITKWLPIVLQRVDAGCYGSEHMLH